MRIKSLFTVPENQKITEKQFLRVLISTVCSIILCIGCLVRTTWAWVSLEISNENNVIQLGAFVADARITSNLGRSFIPPADVDNVSNGFTYHLLPGEYTVELSRASHSTASGYCIVTVDGVQYKTVLIESEKEAISFCISIQAPDPEKLAEIEQLAETDEANETETTTTYVSVVTIVPTWGMPVSESALLGSVSGTELTGEALTLVDRDKVPGDVTEPEDDMNTEASTDNEEPSSSVVTEQPTDNEELSSTATEQPTDNEESSSTTTEQPTDNEEPSPTATEQPTDNEESSSTTTERPTDNEESSSTATELPTDNEEPSSTATEQPTDNEEPSSTTTEQPTDNEEPSSTTTEQPTDNEEPSSIATELPTDNEESSATVTTENNTKNENS